MCKRWRSGLVSGEGKLELNEPGNYRQHTGEHYPEFWGPKRGIWDANVLFRGNNFPPWGEVRILVPEPDLTPVEKVTAPNDAGPEARPNGWAKARVPLVFIRQGLKVGTLRITAIRITDGRGFDLRHDWVEAPIVVEPRKCKNE